MKRMFCTFILFCLCSLRGVFGDSVSVMEGDSVSLNSSVTKIPEDDDILWKFGANKSLIAEMSGADGIFSIKHDVLDGRFRDRLKLDNQTGSLTITNITTKHAGDYEVQIRGAKLRSKTFSVSVYARLPVPILNSSRCPSSQYNCSVLCSVVNVTAVSLSWYKGNGLLSSISVSDQIRSLSLDVEYQDTYSCVVNNSISNQTTQLNITQLCQPCNTPSGLHLPLLYIVLICTAAGLLLTVVIVCLNCICKKRQRRVNAPQMYVEYNTDSPQCKKTTRKTKLKDAGCL
ncbi:CD48 antigen-like isoform X2 [Danio rerio]|uniref:CD48 antigen-like isoform X2 n=1 Tax=Danio rerio TaxID=7955 RepID=A0AC58IGB9_DANRE